MSVRAEINTTFDGYVNVCLMGDGVDKLSDDEIAEAAHSAILKIGKIKESDRGYQSRVAEWLESCFGESDDPLRKSRRVHRFVEEAIELAQALDCSKSDVLELVDYVFGRPVGEPKQEVGGVLVTLMALCSTYGINAAQCGEDELSRVWTKIDAIRAKNARQVRGSALPGTTVDEKGIDVT